MRGLPIIRLAALLCVIAWERAEGQLTTTEYLPWSQAQSRFLNREYYPWWHERYENYSLLSYRDYTARPENPTYDPFGAYLLDGVELLRVEEYRTLAPQRSSRIFRSGHLAATFRNLVIMRDHYRDWSARVMVGDALEARFTPLTLDKARLQGLRWDGSSYKNRFTVLGARVSSPLVGGDNNLPFATYLFGGRWESRLGNVLTVGGSYVNLHLRDSMQRRGSTRGTFPTDLAKTTAYYVVFSDDSPEDDSGVQVLAVEIFVDGAPLPIEPDIRRIPHLADPDHVPHLRRHGPWAPQSVPRDRVFDPRLNNRRRERGLFFQQGLPVSAAEFPLEVGGTDLLVYRWEIPATAERLSFRAQVAGDYSIDVAAAYGWAGVPNRIWTDWHNVARAPRNVRDGSNLRWVRFEYGFPTAQIQYGSDFLWEWEGTTLAGELVENVGYRRFPGASQHQRRASRAFFLKGLHQGFGELSRAMDSLAVGLEVFRLPAAYATTLPMWSERADKVLDYALVDDNDDGDYWEDRWEHWDPLDPLYISLKDAAGVDPESQPTQAALDYLPGNLGNGVGYGVFPGLDQDGDGVLAINVNQNQIPDYAEPFLMYAVEPDDFVYGDDFNNNGVVDRRENDNLPDYPYPLDSRGYHSFALLHLRSSWQFRLGQYRIEQRAGAGRNQVAYGEAQYQRGHVQFNVRSKRVRDTIADLVYQHVVDPLAATNTAIKIKPDLLLAQNSWLHTLYGTAGYAPVPGVQIKATTKLEINRMLERLDQRSHIIDWTWASKADYTFVREGLKIRPSAKLRLQRRTAPEELLLPLRTYELFPILQVDYALGQATVLRFGIQGLPGWPHTFRNPEYPTGDFTARHYLLAIENRSHNRGFDLSLNLGFRASHTRFVHTPGHRVRNFREFFVQARVL